MPDPVIDCAIHHDWTQQDEITDYLSPAWREYVGSPGSLPWGFGAKDIGMDFPYRNPAAGEPYTSSFEVRRSAAKPGRTVESVVEQLNDERVDYGILIYGASMLLPGDNNAYLGRELIAAANRWTSEDWAARSGGRLFGSILAANQFPDEAAKEIRKYASDPNMVQVVMGANGMGKPFGHPVYHPIYQAAAECGLPVLINAWGETLLDTLPHPTAGGPPGGYVETRVLAPQPLITHCTSLIAQGVFEKYPDLRVVLVGGGLAWVPSFLWRLRVNTGSFGRESPWLRRPPADYFYDHFKIGTYRLDRPSDPDLFERVVGKGSPDGSMYMYASGRPFADCDRTADIAELLPPGWRPSVMGRTAQAFYSRLPSGDAHPIS